jgi:sugar phosphate isomerase/epimerase
LVRQTALEIATDCFAQAAEIGAQMVVVHPNSSSDPFTAEAYAASWARTREALVVLAERAQERGVQMLVENMPARGLPRPGSTVIDVLKMIDGLGDHVGVCLDVGHSYANGISPAEEMRQAGDKLLEVHLQDNDGGGEDQHWIMGAGGIDWEAYHEAVAETAFEGFQVFEVLRGDTPQALLAQMARMRREWEER